MLPWLYQYQKLRHPRHVAEISRALIDIVDHANHVLWPLVQETGVEDLVRRTGSLSVYGTEADMRAMRQQMADRRRPRPDEEESEDEEEEEDEEEDSDSDVSDLFEEDEEDEGIAFDSESD